MPTLRPMMPVTIFYCSRGPTPARARSATTRLARAAGAADCTPVAGFTNVPARPSVLSLSTPEPRTASREPRLLMLFPERLDLDVDAGRQVELHQRVHRLRRGLENVDQALVRPQLELLARLLVDVRRSQHRPLVLLGRERDRACQPCARAPCRVHDLRRR